MPLIVAVILLGGTFFGYAGGDSARKEIKAANAVHQKWLKQKEQSIAVVAMETLKNQEVK